MNIVRPIIRIALVTAIAILLLLTFFIGLVRQPMASVDTNDFQGLASPARVETDLRLSAPRGELRVGSHVVTVGFVDAGREHRIDLETRFFVPDPVRARGVE